MGLHYKNKYSQLAHSHRFGEVYTPATLANITQDSVTFGKHASPHPEGLFFKVKSENIRQQTVT